jgi:hypothetical protein
MVICDGYVQGGRNIPCHHARHYTYVTAHGLELIPSDTNVLDYVPSLVRLNIHSPWHTTAGAAEESAASNFQAVTVNHRYGIAVFVVGSIEIAIPHNSIKVVALLASYIS